MRKNGITDNYQPSFDQMFTPTKKHDVYSKIYPTVLYRILDSDIACLELNRPKIINLWIAYFEKIANILNAIDRIYYFKI